MHSAKSLRAHKPAKEQQGMGTGKGAARTPPPQIGGWQGTCPHPTTLDEQLARELPAPHHLR